MRRKNDFMTGKVIELAGPLTFVGMSCDLPKKTKIKILKQRLQELEKNGKRNW